MSDLAIIDPSVALEHAADPGAYVVFAIEHGRNWLTEALAHNDLNDLVNAKGWAVTLKTAVYQKKLGKDAELSAQELVRRAEHCLVLGIRQGQEAGEIRRPGQSKVTHHQRDDNTLVPIASPTDFAASHELRGGGDCPGMYALADDVTNDQFEAAITEAKAEGNLSRANVVRKTKRDKPAPSPERSEWHRKRRRIDPERIIEQTISTLDGIADGLALIEDISSLDAEKRLVWSEALRLPLAAINRFKKELSS